MEAHNLCECVHKFCVYPEDKNQINLKNKIDVK